MTKQIVTSYKIIDGKFYLSSPDGRQVESHDAVWEGNFNCSHNKLTSLDGLQGCTFGGDFDCSYNKLTSLDGIQGCTFGGWFNCGDNHLTSLDGLQGCTFGGGFDCSHNQLTSLGGLQGCTFGSGFNCSHNQLTSLDGLQGCTFGGWFNCGDNHLTSLDGLQGCTFGGDFDCSHNKLTSLDGLQGCTFGGWFDCRDNKLPVGIKLPPTYQDVWEPFLAKGYVFADGMLTKLIHKRGDVYKTQKIGSDKIVYVIKDGDTFSHGKTVKAARLDLAFKKSDRDVEDYKNLPLDTRKEPEEWALIYRTITGACQEGTEMFMDGKGKLKKSYTLAEILAETAGAYNSEKFRQIVTGE